mgnify:CR=1 FL=1
MKRDHDRGDEAQGDQDQAHRTADRHRRHDIRRDVRLGEFGRRAEENAEGTDHGAAGNAFLIGKPVRVQWSRADETARAEGDFTSEQFMQWFIKEQVEEVATMSDLLRVVERSKDDPMDIENFMAREHPGGESEDPTAPHPAGGE